MIRVCHSREKLNLQRGSPNIPTFMLMDLNPVCCVYLDAIFTDFNNTPMFRDRDRVVGTSIRHGMDCPGLKPRLGRHFFLLVQNSHVSIPNPVQWVTLLFPGLKRQGCDVNRAATSSAESKERVNIYNCCPSRPSWYVVHFTFLWPRINLQVLMCSLTLKEEI